MFSQYSDGCEEFSSSPTESESGSIEGFKLSDPRKNEALFARKLNLLIKANPGYHIIQQNGQRVFEPVRSVEFGNAPRGCEIFIGNIPKHVYEDLLIPMFQEAGKLHKFRLMLDFNQKTRGYGFACYFNPADTQRAINRFNECEIIRHVRLAVYLSIDNRRLFVGNIPREITVQEVLDVFRGYVDGVERVIMCSSLESQNQNRGFAFVEFESHLQASKARRQLHPRNLIMWDQNLYVDWADPIPDVSCAVMAQVSVLFLNNLPHDVNNEHLEQVIEALVSPHYEFVTRVHKVVTFAFVHCRDRLAAEYVKQHLVGFTLLGRDVDVDWARPREYSSQWRSQMPPDNFCLSVPIQTRRAIREMANARRATHRFSRSRAEPIDPCDLDANMM